MAELNMECRNKQCRAYLNLVIINDEKDNRRCAECNNALYPADVEITEVGGDDDGSALQEALEAMTEGGAYAHRSMEDEQGSFYFEHSFPENRHEYIVGENGYTAPYRGNGNGSYQPAPSKKELINISEGDEVFSCDPDIEGCPIVNKPTVYVPYELFNTWVFLCNRFDTEWIAYLRGSEIEEEPNNYIIEEMYFPTQIANGGHCDAQDGEIQEDTIAAIHSHVNMNAFFSGEDRKHFNHLVEMVINRKGEAKAMTRVKLDCGKYAREESQILLVDCEKQMELVEQLKQKIVQSARQTTFRTNTTTTSTAKQTSVS